MPDRKKKIVFAVSNDLATDQRVQKMADFYVSQNWEVVILGRKLPQSPAITFQHGYKRFKLWFNKGSLFYANLNIRLFTYLLSYKTDVILANDLDTLAACYYASRFSKKPIVFDSHEYFTEVPELIQRKKVQRFWKAIERNIVPKLQYCITVSQSIADLFQEEYGVKFHLVRNVPKIAATQVLTTEKTIPEALKIDLNIPFIIYQGALNIGRGIELAIKSMQFITNAQLVIAGTGDIEKDLKNLVQELQLTDKVHFLGRVNPMELKKITALAHVGFSLEEDMGLNYRFSLPNKIFDYVHAEIPCVVSNLQEMGTLVNQMNLGLVIEERTPEHLAKSFEIAINDTLLRKQWIESARKAQKILNWEKETEVIRDEILPHLI